MYPNNYYNMYNPQMRMIEQQPQNFILKGHPVSSIDEAKAMTIDFDGSIFYFPDIANKRIYTKQIGPDGNVIIMMYEQKEIENNNKENIYVTKEELQQSVDELRRFIETKSIANNF